MREEGGKSGEGIGEWREEEGEERKGGRKWEEVVGEGERYKERNGTFTYKSVELEIQNHKFTF